MKLLFLTPRFHINLFYRLRALSHAGYTVDLGTVYRGGSERTDGCEPTVIGHMFLYRVLVSFLSFFRAADPDSYRWLVSFGIVSPWRLYQLIRKSEPDIVLIRANKSMFTISTLVFVRLLGKRVMLLAQTGNHGPGSVRKQYLLYVLREVFGVERIVSPIKNTEEDSDPLYVYAPFVIDATEYKERDHQPREEVRIISVGKFQERKGHLTLLRAFNSLREKYADATLCIVGGSHSGDVEEEIKQFIGKHSLMDTVTVYRDIPHREMLELYRSYDIFVLPSYNEPAAFSPLEAMAVGLPVIVSDSCGTKGYIREGENGFVFHAKDEQDLLSKIQSIIEAGPDTMGRRSRQIAETEYALETYAKAMREIVGEPKT